MPQWAIDSCKKIKYMFPRGHAVAYVTMGLRVAWYKVYRPLAYYAAYFTIRADGFDATTMILSNASIRDRLSSYASRDEKLNVKEKLEENALHMVLEMQERGIRLLHVDLSGEISALYPRARIALPFRPERFPELRGGIV